MADDPKIPNPDLMPAPPAITRDAEGDFVMDGTRLPRWTGPCLSCAHFQAIAHATDSRQDYVDADGKKRQRLFVTWQRFCLVGPENIEIADADIAWCSRYELQMMGPSFAKLIGGENVRLGNTPIETEDES